jgi:hypothetical protein
MCSTESLESSLKKFIAIDAGEIEINVSPESCEYFGCTPGDRFTLLKGVSGLKSDIYGDVIGVASCPCCGDEPHLWVKADGQERVQHLTSTAWMRAVFYKAVA